MTYAFVAVTDATLGGVYYCADFTTSGAQPVWTRLTTTGLPSTEPDIFRVDYGNPLSVQYLGFNCTANTNLGEIYARNGGNWSKVMDTTIASTVTGAAITYVNWLWTNPYSDYGLYCIVRTNRSGFTSDNYVLESLDYGANWSVYGVPIVVYEAIGVNVIGDYAWVSARGTLSTLAVASLDGGATWGSNTLVGGGWDSDALY